MASTDLVFGDEASCNAALANVRSDASDINWVLFTYNESAKNTIDLVAKGSGGIEEMKPHFNESKMFYGLCRVTDKIDQSVTVKFVFIVWCGEKVPFVQKAKMTTHKGSITKLIGQFHNDVHASNINELSDEIIMGKVMDASGTATRVKGGDVAPSSPQTISTANRAAAAPRAATSKGAGGSAKPPSAPSTSQLAIDEEAIHRAIKAVRSDADDTDWCLIGYEASNNKVILQGTGSDGLDELITHLKDDQVHYGLYRTTDTVDNTVAVKFVFICWVGEKLPIMRKARVTTHKGEILNIIGQHHVDVNCSNKDEINDDIVRDLVQRASGTANRVK